MINHRLPSTTYINAAPVDGGAHIAPPSVSTSLPISKASTTIPVAILTGRPMKDAAPKASIIPPPGNGGRYCNDEHLIDDFDTQIWGAHEASGRGMTPRIPMAPQNMRIKDITKLPHWLLPRVVSIGPYNYGRGGSLLYGEKIKARHAQQFLDETEQTRDDLYRKIRPKTPELRKWYNVTTITRHSDSQLATIFLLDGCFLLNFINYCYSSKDDGLNDLDLTSGVLNDIKQEVFLLENQLPYDLLRLLFEDTKPSKPSMEEKIKAFVESHALFPQGTWAKEVLNPSPWHLLQTLHSVLLQKPGEGISPPQKQDDEGHRRQIRTNWRSCRTVRDLMEVGIYFKPSETSCLTDISFRPDDFGPTGCLKLPTISMNTSTMVTFLNLIALESANPTSTLGVISYLCFMDSLIDSWDDVKELQAAGILRNFVGEPKDVAQFFNLACSELVPNPYAFRDVRQQIESHVERHYNSRLRTWYVECKQKYFSSPWSSIALIAAIIGLSLTGIQTYTSLSPQ